MPVYLGLSVSLSGSTVLIQRSNGGYSYCAYFIHGHGLKGLGFTGLLKVKYETYC